MNGTTQSSGIGRRRGAATARGGSRIRSSILVCIGIAVVSLSFLTIYSMIFIVTVPDGDDMGFMSLSKREEGSAIIIQIMHSVRNGGDDDGSSKGQKVNMIEEEHGDSNNDEEDDDDDELMLMSNKFRKYAAILRAELHLVAIDTSGSPTFGSATSLSNNNNNNERDISNHSKNEKGYYRGVKASFCKLDWNRYKNDPPSLPMFKHLVSASGCNNNNNTTVTTLDLATVVQITKEYDDTHTQRHNTVRVIPPSGFVFHESRVGSTLVANSLTAMDPEGHRVYSESNPINMALKSYSCDRGSGESGGSGGNSIMPSSTITTPSCNSNMEASVALLRDVTYLMGRTTTSSSNKERRMFFKLASNGSKRIDLVERAFPSVPWIFVFRDPVQTLMSHLVPKDESSRGGVGAEGRKGGVGGKVCLKTRKRPQEDLVRLVRDYHGGNVDGLSREEFCAAYLATLCESALKGFHNSNGNVKAVEYDNLVTKLIQDVIPIHFGIKVDENARQRILNVSTVYSKSKNGDKDWLEDSSTKDARSTLEIRAASEKFLSFSYLELKKYT